MAVPRLVVVGASSGGIEALRTFVQSLPADLAAAVCVVVHTAAQSPAVLDVILRRAGRLEASNARHGERMKPGRIYVAPPDRHLTVEPGVLHLSRGPKENRFRPAIDPLFRSAAQVYGPGAVGVILSGNLDDGASGLRTIKRLGGVALVQDPAEAMFPSMPLSALRQVDADHVASASELGRIVESLVSVPLQDRPRVDVPRDVEVEVNIARDRNPMDSGVLELGDPSSITCPECHGVLLRLKEQTPARFRCHTGHAYTADSLLAAVDESIEEALWSSVRALQEGMLLLEHLQQHWREQHGEPDAGAQEQIDAARGQADVIRRLVLDRRSLQSRAGSDGRRVDVDDGE